MADVLNVKRRDQLGTSSTRRLRKTGVSPAELYGHGEANVSLVLTTDEVLGVIRHGHKMVRLQGDVAEGAFIKSVQWDVFGKLVLHIDLLRVSETEMVETTVAVELRGTAAGLGEGGIIEFLVHEVEIECPAAAVPEKLLVNVNDLHLGKAIHASEIPLPAGAKMLTDEDTVIVHCVAPHDEGEGLGEPGTAEPELIRAKEKEGEEGAGDKK